MVFSLSGGERVAVERLVTQEAIAAVERDLAWNWGQLTVLRRLTPPRTRIRDVAESCGLFLSSPFSRTWDAIAAGRSGKKRQELWEALQSLIELGLVEKRADPLFHYPRIVYTLTESGQRLVLSLRTGRWKPPSQ